MTETILISLFQVLLIFSLFLSIVPIMIWVERRGAALIQDRPGPNRVGPFGLLQPIADSIKFLFKEDPIPLGVHKLLYILAPFFTLLPAVLVLAALPIGDYIVLFGNKVFLEIADLNISLIYFLSIGSLGVYGILFGGWASSNKYSLLGATRSASQILSYELPLGIAAIGAVMIYGTFSLREMAYQQEGTLFWIFPHWGVFMQPLGFLIFFIASFAETNRLPFDLPETDAELVAGYHTEYGSMKFAAFFMAEYLNMASMSALMVVLYFGAWHLPWISDDSLRNLLALPLVACIQVAVFFIKVAIFLLVFVWVRWTVPRFRYDQLIRLTWTGLVPLGIFNLAITSILIFLSRA